MKSPVPKLNRQLSIQQQKKNLFSHASGNTAITQMKSVTSHLHTSRDLLLKSLDQISHINQGLSNTSANLERTNYMYDQYDEKTKKSSLYINQLKRREANNARNIKAAFWFLMTVCIYIIIRRFFFGDLYRWR